MECTYNTLNTRALSYFLITRNWWCTFTWTCTHWQQQGYLLQSIPASTVVKELHGDISQKTIIITFSAASTWIGSYKYSQEMQLSYNTINTQQNINSHWWEMVGNFYSIILMRTRRRPRQNRLGKMSQRRKLGGGALGRQRQKLRLCFRQATQDGNCYERRRILTA